MKAQLNKIPASHYWENFLTSNNTEQLFNSNQIGDIGYDDLFHKFVCIVNIETSTFCNKKCTYCPISTFDRRTQVLMDDNIFSNIVFDLKSINYSSTISLNIFNEPLADKSFYGKITKIRDACPDAFIKFNSNGDYIKLDVLDKLVSLGVNAIFVTLHPEPGEGYTDKSRLQHFEKFFSKLEINWKIDKSIPNQQITSDNLYKGMRLLVESHNWEVKGNDRGGAVPELSTEMRTSPCVRPIREFAISYDGSVYPCCQFFTDDSTVHKYRIGKLEATDNDNRISIFDIYGSNLMTQWRKALLPFSLKSSPCSSCNDPDNSCISSNKLRYKLINNL